jgi:hypothetical protein
MKTSACPSGVLARRWKHKWRAVWPMGLIALSAAMGGCQSAPPPLALLQRSYHPNNIFAFPRKLSPNFQRVAVLPIAAETLGNDLPEGCATLTPILWDQLLKTKKFELVAVDPLTLRGGTGQPGWTGLESLPPGFLDFLRREYACDGILFAELTTYHAYAPLAIGWRLKLVDVRTGQVIWSADELFDATRLSVSHGAQRFAEPGWAVPFCHTDNPLALESPRQFGNYSAAALLGTLPGR